MTETISDMMDRLVVTPGPEGDVARAEVQRGADEFEAALRTRGQEAIKNAAKFEEGVE